MRKFGEKKIMNKKLLEKAKKNIVERAGLEQELRVALQVVRLSVGNKRFCELTGFSPSSVAERLKTRGHVAFETLVDRYQRALAPREEVK